MRIHDATRGPALRKKGDRNVLCMHTEMNHMMKPQIVIMFLCDECSSIMFDVFAVSIDAIFTFE